jgi:glycosyltransferase involved in cell wall biosynthesis
MTTRRVLHTNFLHGWGGQSNRILTVSEGLAELGWDVLVSAPGDSQLVKRARAKGIAVNGQICYAGGLKPKCLPDILAMRQLLREYRPDIIHLHGGKDSWVVAAAMCVNPPIPKPLIIRTKHNVFPVADHFLNRWQYGRFFEWIICLSTAIVDQMRGKPYVNPDRLVMIPSAIDAGRFDVAQGTRNRMRAEFGYCDDDLVVGITGRLCPEKGHDVLLRAVPLVLATCPKARFLVVGAGSLEGELTGLISALGITDNVRMVGFREDVPDCLAAMDIYVQPSRSEGLGTSVLEASAAGLPIAASRTGGIPDVVLDGQTGILVKPESSQDLAAGILRLAGDPGLRVRLGSAARRHVSSEFSVSRMVVGIDGHYRKALERGPKPT